MRETSGKFGRRKQPFTPVSTKVEWADMGTFGERFESRPPEGVTLSSNAQSAFQMVALAIAETATAQDHRNSGRRIYSGCGCKRCRRGHIIDFPAVSRADRLAA